MPYFYFGLYRSNRTRRCTYARKTFSVICPDGDETTHGLCLPLTLDQYCNPALEEETLDHCNGNQVVFRSASRQRHVHVHEHRSSKSTRGRECRPPTPLLLVHEVWVYRFYVYRIFTFPDAFMQESTIRNVLTRRGPKVDPVFELTLLLSAFVKLLETPLGLPKPVSDMYEESISAVSHEADDYSKKTIKDQERSADTEKQYFHEISNIREETAMIRSVISQQHLRRRCPGSSGDDSIHCKDYQKAKGILRLRCRGRPEGRACPNPDSAVSGVEAQLCCCYEKIPLYRAPRSGHLWLLSRYHHLHTDGVRSGASWSS